MYTPLIPRETVTKVSVWICVDVPEYLIFRDNHAHIMDTDLLISDIIYPPEQAKILNRARKSVKDGDERSSTGRFHRQGSHSRMMRLSSDHRNVQAREFIIKFVKDAGQFMPHLWEVHLPLPNVTTLYEAYWTSMHVKGFDMLTPRHFQRIFNENFSAYVKFPPIRRFARCTTCDDIDDKIQKSITDEISRMFVAEKEKHIDGCMQEHQEYGKKKLLAITYPDEYISLSIDAMDQKKTAAPCIRNSSKKYSEVEQLTISLMGVLVHGHAPGAIVFPVTPQFAKDGSLVAQVLLQTLKLIKEGRPGKPWPKTMFLQLDNAGNQNKNRAIFGVLSALVQLKIFDRVHTMAPQPPNTHNVTTRHLLSYCFVTPSERLSLSFVMCRSSCRSYLSDTPTTMSTRSLALSL